MTVTMHVQLLDRPLLGKCSKLSAFHRENSWLLQGTCLPSMHCTLDQIKPCIPREVLGKWCGDSMCSCTVSSFLGWHKAISHLVVG